MSRVLLLCVATLLCLAVSRAALIDGVDVQFVAENVRYKDACKSVGGRLFDLTALNLAAANKIITGRAWVRSWNGDDYGGSFPLALTKGGAVNVWLDTTTSGSLCVGGSSRTTTTAAPATTTTTAAPVTTTTAPPCVARNGTIAVSGTNLTLVFGRTSFNPFVFVSFSNPLCPLRPDGRGAASGPQQIAQKDVAPVAQVLAGLCPLGKKIIVYTGFVQGTLGAAIGAAVVHKFAEFDPATNTLTAFSATSVLSATRKLLCVVPDGVAFNFTLGGKNYSLQDWSESYTCTAGTLAGTNFADMNALNDILKQQIGTAIDRQYHFFVFLTSETATDGTTLLRLNPVVDVDICASSPSYPN